MHKQIKTKMSRPMSTITVKHDYDKGPGHGWSYEESTLSHSLRSSSMKFPSKKSSYGVSEWKVKAIKYIAPHMANCSSSDAVVSDGASIQPIGRRVKPVHARLGPCSQTATHGKVLPFNGLHLSPEGMEGWVGMVSWPIVDTLPTCQPQIKHRSG